MGRRQQSPSGQWETECRSVWLPRKNWASSKRTPTVIGASGSRPASTWVTHQNAPPAVSVYW